MPLQSHAVSKGWRQKPERGTHVRLVDRADTGRRLVSHAIGYCTNDSWPATS
jgi:hypothetical protein